MGEKRYYIFAYGSNLNSADFMRYCKEKGIEPFYPEKVCNAHAKTYHISWSVYSKSRNGGALNIQLKTKDMYPDVWGTVFSLTDEQLAVFDRKEGHPKHYQRVPFVVLDPTENEMYVETYIAPPCRETAWFFPRKQYKDIVVEGLKEQNIPSDYIKDFSARSPIIDFEHFTGQNKHRTVIYSGYGVGGKTLCYWQDLYAAHDLGTLEILYSHLFSLEKLREYDLLIIPGGDSKNICAGLGDREKNDIRKYLLEGGKLLGVCAGAYAVSHELRRYIGLSPVKIVDYEHAHRGEALLKLSFNEEGQKWFGVVDDQPVPIIYHNGPVPYEVPLENCSEFQVMATFEEEICLPEGKPNTMIHQPAAWKNRYGKGQVFAICSHIERTEGKQFLMANFIENIQRSTL